jgi:hypothetical protein
MVSMFPPKVLFPIYLELSMQVLTRIKHHKQDAINAAHDDIMSVIQFYASGLCTMPELLVALQKHHALFPIEDGKIVAIVGIHDPATNLVRIA